LEAEVYGYLDRVNGGKYDPTERKVNAMIHALKGRVLLPDDAEPGSWLGEGEPPWGTGEIMISCKNGVVRMSDGRIWPHDARLFVLNSIDTEFAPEATAPRWMQFLDELWAGDLRSKETLQEWFGLVLTDVLEFQKSLMLVGPGRSGKGTIAKVLRTLLGRNNYCGPSLNQLTSEFGMQHFPGKKLAVIPDARLDGKSNRSIITEKLLSVIAGDPIDINRKNKGFLVGVILRLKVMILSNELPDFKDDAGVIATRFIILQTMVSFLGREEHGLDTRLAGELSGILNWALEGWRRLVVRDRFAPPGNGANEELATIASSIKAFVAECCEVGPGFTVGIDTIFAAYREWCGTAGVGWADRLQINQFSAKLHSAFYGQVETVRPRQDNPGRKRMFAGVRLRGKLPTAKRRMVAPPIAESVGDAPLDLDAIISPVSPPVLAPMFKPRRLV
jgi:putative DNA primase/helicase